MKKPVVTDILLILGFGFLLFVLNTWAYPLFDVDEPRYAETAREMLTSPGDWITPHFNWAIRFDKPVLFYWLIAGAYQVFGVSEFAARLISALSATSIALMLYGVMKPAFNRSTALMTAGIAMTMLQMYVFARMSVTDMTLACFMAATWLGLHLALTGSPRWYLAAGAAGALGMLTKGPVAIALPGLTFLFMLVTFYRHRARAILLSRWPYLGLLVFVLLAAPWYIAVIQANPGEFIGTFFFMHNVQRFSGTLHGHGGTWYYYIPVLLVGAFPWIVFLPGVITKFIENRKALPDIVRFAAVWFITVFGFFTVSATKLITYILPALPALAILVGWYWHQRLQDQEKPSRFDLFYWVIPFLFLFGGVYLIRNPYALVPEYLRPLYTPWVLPVGLLLVFAVWSLFIWLNKLPRTRLKAVSVLILGVGAVWMYCSLLVFPMAATIYQSDVVRFANRALKDKMALASYRKRMTSLVFYTRRKTYYLPDKAEPKAEIRKNLRMLFKDRPAAYVIARNRDMEDLEAFYDIKPVEKGYLYTLVLVNRPNTLLKEMRP